MRLLLEEFEYDGFSFRLIDRRGGILVFEKSKSTHTTKSYEVVILQRRPERIIGETIIPAHEAMPSNEQWGQAGWTYTNSQDAITKMKELTRVPEFSEQFRNGEVSTRKRKKLCPTP